MQPKSVNKSYKCNKDICCSKTENEIIWISMQGMQFYALFKQWEFFNIIMLIKITVLAQKVPFLSVGSMPPSLLLVAVRLTENRT